MADFCYFCKKKIGFFDTSSRTAFAQTVCGNCVNKVNRVATLYNREFSEYTLYSLEDAGKILEKAPSFEMYISRYLKIRAEYEPQIQHYQELAEKEKKTLMLERSEYEALTTAAKKYIAQEKKESKLQKALDAANKLIAELKAKIASLTKELSEYKSARGKLQAAGLEQENESLRSKLRSYEAVIERNNLWSYFARHRAKTPTRDETR